MYQTIERRLGSREKWNGQDKESKIELTERLQIGPKMIVQTLRRGDKICQ